MLLSSLLDEPVDLRLLELLLFLVEMDCDILLGFVEYLIDVYDDGRCVKVIVLQLQQRMDRVDELLTTFAIVTTYEYESGTRDQSVV
jgi:hypothetical protein